MLQKWPEGGPPLAWKITGLGGGDSAPAIAAGRVFGMGTRGEDEVVWALSEKDGKELICTPGGDDALLVALDKMTGKPIWKSRMPGASADANAAPAGPDAPGRAGALTGAGGPIAGSAAVVAGTQDPALFQSEHFGMRAFSSELPNDNYLPKLYYRTEDGTMLLIEPSRKEYLERGRFEQPDRSRPPAWAHPVVANGRLYIRDQGLVFCYTVKATGR